MLLRKCCFVGPLRFGVGFAAFLTLVFSVYFLVRGSQILVEYLASDKREKEALLDLFLFFTVFGMGITMFIALCVGLINELLALRLFWLIGSVILVAVLIAYLVHHFTGDRELDLTDYILLGMLPVWVYLWIVVLSYKES